MSGDSSLVGDKIVSECANEPTSPFEKPEVWNSLTQHSMCNKRSVKVWREDHSAYCNPYLSADACGEGILATPSVFRSVKPQRLEQRFESLLGNRD